MTQPLRERDFEILQLASMLFTAAETGKVIGMSRSTIEKDRNSVARALEVRSMRQAVRVAYKDAYLPLPPRLMQKLLDRVADAGMS
jgi:DNA-binding CsgD family transcriptional regulator